MTGYGKIHGRPTFVFPRTLQCSVAVFQKHAEKIVKIMDKAMQLGVPVIGLNDSGGARIQEGVASRWICRRLSGKCAGIRCHSTDFRRHGPIAGGAVYSPAMTDFIFMVRDSSYVSYVHICIQTHLQVARRKAN